MGQPARVPLIRTSALARHSARAPEDHLGVATRGQRAADAPAGIAEPPAQIEALGDKERELRECEPAPFGFRLPRLVPKRDYRRRASAATSLVDRQRSRSTSTSGCLGREPEALPTGHGSAPFPIRAAVSSGAPECPFPRESDSARPLPSRSKIRARRLRTFACLCHRGRAVRSTVPTPLSRPARSSRRRLRALLARCECRYSRVGYVRGRTPSRRLRLSDDQSWARS